MKNRYLALLLIPLMFTTTAYADGGWSGNLRLQLGSKTLSSDDWWANSHGETGIFIDVGGPGWPVNIVFDMLGSYGKFEGFDYAPGPGIFYVEEEMSSGELNLGVRHYFAENMRIRPYVGGGIAFITVETDWSIDSGPVFHDEGHGSGIWLNGGLLWDFSAFNLGFDIRMSSATVELDSGDFQGGGVHSGLVFGYNW